MSYAKLAFGAVLKHTFGSNLPNDHWAQVDVVIPATTFTACSDGDLFGFTAQFLSNQAAGLLAEDITYPSGVWRWIANFGSPAASGPAPATTYTIKYHYVSPGATVSWYVNGVLVLTQTGAFSSPGNEIELGASPEECCCEVYYFTNVKVGTSDGASDLFADDFSGGLGNWTILGDAPFAAAAVPAVSSAPCPTVTASPARGQAGNTFTLSGTGFDPGSALGLSFGTTPIGEFAATADGSGNFTTTLTVPEGLGAGGSYGIYVTDDAANIGCGTFDLCGARPSDGITTAPNPVIASGGITNNDNEILDYIFHDGAHWVLWQDQSVTGTNLTTFPPPANHTMNATRISADGSSVTDYPINTEYQWVFGSGDVNDPGLGSSRTCPTGGGTVNAPVWDSYFYFSSWAKPIYDAHFASDGTTLWVAVLTRETILYPWLDNQDACFPNPGSLNQLIPLSTLTLGFTTFATTTGVTGYHRYNTQTDGAINIYKPNAFPVTDAGEADSGYWSPPCVAIFSFGGGGFSRIGTIDAAYCPGQTNGQSYSTQGIIGTPQVTQVAPRGSLVSRVAMCASENDPGRCHIVWSEGGDWGRHGEAAPGCTRLTWDGGPQNRNYRINYTTWGPGGKLSDNDIAGSHVDRTNWWFPNDFGSLGNTIQVGYTWPDQADFGGTCILDVRNDNAAGTPYLFLSWQQAIGQCWDGGSGGVPSFVFPPAPLDPDGNPWLDNNLLWCDTLHIYDISGGTAVLKQSISAPLLPDEAEVEFFHHPSPPLGPPFTADSLFGATAITDGSNPVSSQGPLDKAFGISLPYDDPELGVPVYLVHVPWTRRWVGNTSGGFTLGGSSVSTRGFYRVPCDMSAPFDFLDGTRQLRFTIVKLPAQFVSEDFNSSDFFSDTRNIWVPSATGPGLGFGGFPGLWFDRICINTWVEFATGFTPNPIGVYWRGSQCPGFYYDPVADSISTVTSFSATEPAAGPLFDVTTLFICRDCNSCTCGVGIHIAHRF